MDKKQPEEKFTAFCRGGVVTAAIWANDIEVNGERRVARNFTLSRRYKEGSDWKSTSSFGPGDLSALQVVIRKAEDYLLLAAPESTPREEAAE